MNKVKSLFLTLTVAMLTVISGYANQGTEYFQGSPVFAWKTSDKVVSLGVCEHFLTVTQLCPGDLILYNVSCDNSSADGHMSLHGPGQVHSTHFADQLYGPGNWRWSFHIDGSSYSQRDRPIRHRQIPGRVVVIIKE